MRNNRDSNFEILRLILMFSITLHHFLVHGLNTAGYFNNNIDLLVVFLNSFLITGVNTFILISGYYSIKVSMKGALNLYLTCVFYLLLFVGVEFSLTANLNAKNILRAFLPFSADQYWFIQSYFYLFLLSPLLNKAVEHIKKSDFITILILYSIIVFYFGLIRQNDINKNGYNVINFIYLYLLGNSIHHHLDVSKIKKNRLIIIYLGSSILLFLLCVFILKINLNFHFIPWYIFTYNNPLVILSAVVIILYFSKLKLHNKLINNLAKSTLAIYLIQENPYFSKSILYSLIHEFGQGKESYYTIPILIIVALIFMGCCLLIDKIRIIIVQNVIKILDSLGFFKLGNMLKAYFLKIIP